MKEKTVVRYSEAFKMQVVEDLERGRFSSVFEAQRYHDIGAFETVKRWVKKYGKNHLLAKQVRVEKPDEVDRIKQLKKKISDLERALGRTAAENVLNKSYLEIACEQLGKSVEDFKKKDNGQPCKALTSKEVTP